MTDETSDAMKARAESAPMRKRVEGLDGAGWVAAIDENPARSLPAGAGWLVVEQLRAIALGTVTASGFLRCENPRCSLVFRHVGSCAPYDVGPNIFPVSG